MINFHKKVVAIILVSILFIMQFNFIVYIHPVNAANNENVSGVQIENEHYKYYYAQLSEQAKKIYDAMYEMYISGDLKEGNSNYDLVANKKISEDLVKAYKNGDNELIISFETARDAFYLDYPEVFYINMEKYSIRITSDKNSGYHVWLGTGNNNDYYIHGISSKANIESAQVEYEKELKKIVDGAKELSNKEKQIEYVHDAIIASATYKLDNECNPINAGFIRTPYGALVAKEAVCEGYSKAFKVALDKLGIPCILVRGAYKHTDTGIIEQHMWNYVQLDEKWYAVDVTFDDYGGNYSYRDYLLIGSSTENEEHCANGIMSAPEFEFSYPELENEDYGIIKAYDYDGLKVSYGKTQGETLDHDSVTGGKFYISYNGMGIEEASKNGYYFLIKYYLNDQVGNWTYMESLRDKHNTYSNVIKEKDEEFSMELFICEYIQIAVTDVKYNEPILALTPDNKSTNEVYVGGEEHILTSTTKLENYDGKLKPSPNFTSASPYVSSKLTPGKKTHIKVSYNEKLVKEDSNVEPTIRVAMKREGDPESAVENSKIENFGWDENTIWFDFTPSKMWGDNSVIYNFYADGLIGDWSKKAPRSVYYYVQETFGCTYSMSKAHSWRAYARPELIGTNDIDFTGWEFSDGKVDSEQASILNGLTDRMTLVVSKPDAIQENDMNNLINDTGAEVLEKEVYNINLVMCNKNVLKTANGDKVTVYLGFPKGYGPNDAGVTFKAYHFATSNGKVTGVDEIDCVVTPYGLLVTCDAFSPFAVVAVKSTEEDLADTSKSVIFNQDENGKIEGLENNIVKLNKGENKTYTLKSNDGYQIDSVSICGKEIPEASGKTSYEIIVNYDDVVTTNNMINVSYVATEVVQEEIKRGETVIAPISNVLTSDFETVLESDKEKVKPGETFDVTVHIKNLRNISKGIIAITGQFYFNSDILELYSDENQSAISGEDGWRLDTNGADIEEETFNTTNFKFVADNNKEITEDSKIFTIKFKVKDNIEKEQTVAIELNDVTASEGKGVISAVSNTTKNIDIIMRPEPENITSTKYEIGDDVISKISPKTTVAMFRKNVETKQDIIFTNPSGTVLSDTDIVTTGTVIKVGETLSYTLCVRGDIDGDGNITINDLAIVKLNSIGKRKLSGVNLLAADTDGDEKVTINDVAQTKLVIIGKLVIE